MSRTVANASGDFSTRAATPTIAHSASGPHIDLTPHQSHDPDLVEDVRSALARHELAAERLQLGIPVSALDTAQWPKPSLWCSGWCIAAELPSSSAASTPATMPTGGGRREPTSGRARSSPRRPTPMRSSRCSAPLEPP